MSKIASYIFAIAALLLVYSVLAQVWQSSSCVNLKIFATSMVAFFVGCCLKMAQYSKE